MFNLHKNMHYFHWYRSTGCQSFHATAMHEAENVKKKIDVVGAYFYASVVRKNSSITRVQSNFFASMDNAKRQHCD